MKRVLASLLLCGIANAQYQMVKEYIGEHFFDDWAFYNNCELTVLMHAPATDGWFPSRQPHQRRRLVSAPPRAAADAS